MTGGGFSTVIIPMGPALRAEPNVSVAPGRQLSHYSPTPWSHIIAAGKLCSQTDRRCRFWPGSETLLTVEWHSPAQASIPL